MLMYGGMPGMMANLTVARIDPPTQAMLSKVSSPPGTPGAVATPAPVATPGAVAVDIQAEASDIVKTNRDNLVFVTGSAGAGSGFIANMDGATYLMTNAHVSAGISAADFKTLKGATIKGGAAAVAVGHDIFRMAMPAGGKAFEVMQAVDENAAIGDDVVVLGNAEGSGVINTIMGKIVGIGPNLVEIDAQFVPGNSGSPIVHLKTGKVIGVATYLVIKKYDAATREKMAAPVVRRFGYRLDSIKTWQAVDWRLFYAEADAMERIETLTKDLDAFFEDIIKNKGKVTIEEHTNPVIRTRISQWLDSKHQHLSYIDRHEADANFISFLKVACQSDLATVQGRLRYDYFQRELEGESETRNEMAKAFESIIKDIRE